MRLSRQSVLRCITENELHLILLPTEACNFRCTYCYESFEYSRMEPWVVTGIKRLVSKQAGSIERLRVSWFGGEPTLSIDIITDLMSHIQRTKRRHPQIQLDSDLTTNAYLLDGQRFETLLNLGVTTFQVSFDGPASTHDRMRVLARGAGTFDRIWANVCAMRRVRQTFKAIIRLHVDAENLESLPAFIGVCAQAFGDDHRYRLFIRKRSRLGGPGDSKVANFPDEQAKAACERLRRHAEALGLQCVTNEQRPQACYAASGRSFVIRADGHLNKCTVALDHPNNRVGMIREDGTLEVDTAKVHQWMRGLWNRSEEELRCPMVGYAEPIRVLSAVTSAASDACRAASDVPRGSGDVQ